MQRFMTVTAVYSKIFLEAESVVPVLHFQEPYKAQL